MRKKAAKSTPENGTEAPEKLAEIKVKDTPKTASSYPTFRQNPFIDTTIIKTRSKRLTVARGSTIIDSQTGEVEGLTEVAQIFRVDEAQFVKIFTSQIKAFFDLGHGAYRLMQIVLALAQKAPPHTDRIYMNPETLPEELPSISTSAFYRGLAELLEKGFLARVESDRHWYFINPTLFFNGDRVRFITEYRKAEKETRQGRLNLDASDDQPPLLT